jgi:glycosyltransferase involved in cell wall biosynthesis
MTMPAVSIIMPIKNSAVFIRDALDSIAAQSFEDYEVVIVDGASSDDGPAIACSYPKTICVSQQGAGLPQAWNQGIAAACSPFIAFLDSDDVWVAEKLEWQVAAFNRDSRLEYAFGRTEFFLQANEPLPRGFRREVLKGSHLVPAPGSSMICRSAVERMGPFQEGIPIASDIEWLVRLRETSITLPMDRVVLKKRLHQNSLGQTSIATFKSELLQLARQRAAARRKVGTELKPR